MSVGRPGAYSGGCMAAPMEAGVELVLLDGDFTTIAQVGKGV
jgi:hypothetical protein